MYDLFAYWVECPFIGDSSISSREFFIFNLGVEVMDGVVML